METESRLDFSRKQDDVETLILLDWRKMSDDDKMQLYRRAKGMLAKCIAGIVEAKPEQKEILAGLVRELLGEVLVIGALREATGGRANLTLVK